jgi:hypothetical protein
MRWTAMTRWQELQPQLRAPPAFAARPFVLTTNLAFPPKAVTQTWFVMNRSSSSCMPLAACACAAPAHLCLPNTMHRGWWPVWQSTGGWIPRSTTKNLRLRLLHQLGTVRCVDRGNSQRLGIYWVQKMAFTNWCGLSCWTRDRRAASRHGLGHSCLPPVVRLTRVLLALQALHQIQQRPQSVIIRRHGFRIGCMRQQSLWHFSVAVRL